MREYDPEFWDGTQGEPHPVKTIRQVDLAKFYWSVAGIGVADVVEHSVQCSTKLHGLVRAKLYHFLVDIVERVIADETGLMASLGDTAKWGYP